MCVHFRSQATLMVLLSISSWIVVSSSPSYFFHPYLNTPPPPPCFAPCPGCTVLKLPMHQYLYSCLSHLDAFMHSFCSLCHFHVDADDALSFCLFAIFMLPTTDAPLPSANLTTMKKSTMMNCQLDFLFSICCRVCSAHALCTPPTSGKSILSNLKNRND